MRSHPEAGVELLRGNVHTHFDSELFAEFEVAVTDRLARWAA